MPLQATSGAASYDAFGGGVAAVPNYIEDVFSTYLYSGTGSAQTITNGIDLSTKGGLVWIKSRETYSHRIFDTARGVGKTISSNSTGAQFTDTTMLSAFNTTGFSLGFDSSGGVNDSGYTFASWTFRKQPKFFDVVTFTATSSNDQRISHLLGSVPGCIMLKGVDVSSDWFVYHRSVNAPDARQYVTYLNSTVASQFGYGGDIWGASDPTSTDFGFKSGVHLTAGKQYVAYLFAHNAGGFGLTGTDNVISCGSYTGTSTVGNEINVGFEPQFIIIKRATGTAEHWQMFDNMRGIATGGNDAVLYPSLSNAEYAAANAIGLTATGFKIEGSGLNVSGDTYIYIAIRRGPMKVPTSGTSVFKPTKTSAADGTAITVGFPTDSQWANYLAGDGNNTTVFDRLRGMSSTSGSTSQNRTLFTSTTGAESSSFGVNYFTGVNNTGWVQGSYASGVDTVRYDFRRAPSTFDAVCYSGTGTTTTQTHNLQAVPELIIVKRRSGVSYWQIYSATYGRNYYAFLNDTIGFQPDPGNSWGTTDPTSTTFSLSPLTETNASGSTYVAYLWATNPGVTKVGSYTGNGSSQTINCGFTGGSRFVLIKATSTTGNWICVDTARGMTTSSNPVLYLNINAAETATSGACITSTGGFTVDESKLTGVNTSGVSYIFLSYA